jgi:hypothetical protein
MLKPHLRLTPIVIPSWSNPLVDLLNGKEIVHTARTTVVVMEAPYLASGWAAPA